MDSSLVDFWDKHMGWVVEAGPFYILYGLVSLGPPTMEQDNNNIWRERCGFVVGAKKKKKKKILVHFSVAIIFVVDSLSVFHFLFFLIKKNFLVHWTNMEIR